MENEESFFAYPLGMEVGIYEIKNKVKTRCVRYVEGMLRMGAVSRRGIVDGGGYSRK